MCSRSSHARRFSPSGVDVLRPTARGDDGQSGGVDSVRPGRRCVWDSQLLPPWLHGSMVVQQTKQGDSNQKKKQSAMFNRCCGATSHVWAGGSRCGKKGIGRCPTSLPRGIPATLNLRIRRFRVRDLPTVQSSTVQNRNVSDSSRPASLSHISSKHRLWDGDRREHCLTAKITSACDPWN
jgi:hypothetical protein